MGLSPHHATDSQQGKRCITQFTHKTEGKLPRQALGVTQRARLSARRLAEAAAEGKAVVLWALGRGAVAREVRAADTVRVRRVEGGYPGNAHGGGASARWNA